MTVLPLSGARGWAYTFEPWEETIRGCQATSYLDQVGEHVPLALVMWDCVSNRRLLWIICIVYERLASDGSAEMWRSWISRLATLPTTTWHGITYYKHFSRAMLGSIYNCDMYWHPTSNIILNILHWEPGSWKIGKVIKVLSATWLQPHVCIEVARKRTVLGESPHALIWPSSIAWVAHLYRLDTDFSQERHGNFNVDTEDNKEPILKSPSCSNSYHKTSFFVMYMIT